MINKNIIGILGIRVLKPAKYSTIIFYNSRRAWSACSSPVITAVRLINISKSSYKLYILVFSAPVFFQLIYKINGAKTG